MYYSWPYILGLCHSPPRLETLVAHGKIKPQWGKKSCWATASMQKPGVTGENFCWYVTCSTYTLVWKIISISSCGEGDWCHALIFVTCNLCCFFFALLSHYDDLHPRETLSVQSYEFCDSPSITVIQTSCLRGNYLFWLYQCLHQPCDHNSVRGYIRVSWCCHLSPFLCVCARVGMPNIISLFVAASLL